MGRGAGGQPERVMRTRRSTEIEYVGTSTGNQLTARVLIQLADWDEINLLFDVLFDVALDKNPTIGFESEPDDRYLDQDDYEGDRLFPIIGRKEDYQDHPLLPLAQAIQWYAAGDCFTMDPNTVVVKTGANHDLFVQQLRELSISFEIQLA
jgi:hypothetical protein